MASWWEKIRQWWRRPRATPPPPSHLGGQGVPNLLGICQDCGAVVVEGLHQTTPTGFRCQRCANRRSRPEARAVTSAADPE